MFYFCLIGEKTKRWLGWLAVKLQKENETEFLIERMQPYWVETEMARLIYGLIGGLIGGLIVGYIQDRIQSVETLNFSLKELANGLSLGLFVVCL
ncbi:MAG: hypothetical protein F6K10_39930 [Moorea sp. SIO2B7]|nr:hypothetical protein [Moorena sp. SIO2B7]